MTEETGTAIASLIPPQPIPAGARAFNDRVHGLLDGQPKDDATVAKALEGMDEMLDLIAAGLYSMASMLVGEGEDSVRLVETAIANAEISACHDPLEGRKNSRRALCSAALRLLAERDAESLAAPEGMETSTTCIEDDDLDAAGVSKAELEQMFAGPDRKRVRNWLASLPVALRTIFVLRAVAGFTTAETAGLLAEFGGPKAVGWTPDAVRDFFRQGLCSLASQLLKAASSL
jgi:hypothetical protein